MRINGLSEVRSMKVLIIEDDLAIGKALQQGISESGHTVSWAKTGEEGARLSIGSSLDVILLDLMLPGRDGLDVLKELRSAGVETPVIAITALGSVEQRVAGLDLGADDYLVKPFAFAELMARIQAVCRRASSQPVMERKVGDLTLNVATRRARRGTEEIDLTPTEVGLLDLLMRHAGQVVTRKMLCEHIWGFNWDGTTNVIEVHVNHLRGKLDRAGDESRIQTVRGRGYVLRAS